MTAPTILKKIAFSSILAVSAFATVSAYASSRDELGLDKQPICDDADIVFPALVENIGATSTGLKALSSKWDMELFANKKTGEWVLIGKSLDKKNGEVCVLADGKKPYVQEKWYATYFQKRVPTTAPSANTPPRDKGDRAGATSAFAGDWYSNEYLYGFRINGSIGTATISNSPKYSPGDRMLRFELTSPRTFRGTQLFTDGLWYEVSGRLQDERTIQMEGGGFAWVMVRR